MSRLPVLSGKFEYWFVAFTDTGPETQMSLIIKVLRPHMYHLCVGGGHVLFCFSFLSASCGDGGLIAVLIQVCR